MATIHIFNPETDYALAADNVAYTPPTHVAEMRHRMALHPSTYARPGDYIVVDDNFTPTACCPCSIVHFSDLHELIERIGADNVKILPWGWNRSLRHDLIRVGVPETLLPTLDKIGTLRNLAHRRTTIAFYESLQRTIATRNLCETASHFISTNPREVATIDRIETELRSGKEIFIKAPWSSAGRGVIHHRPGEHFDSDFAVARGYIRRQRSAIIEDALPKALDFATLWWIHGPGEVEFIGVSVFDTDGKGGYNSNRKAPQSQLMQLIYNATPWLNDDTIELQRKVINKIISPGYRGPLGIDMLATPDGELCPCVELNLRLTMGFTDPTMVR